jgi:hypothetical protein
MPCSALPSGPPAWRRIERCPLGQPTHFFVVSKRAAPLPPTAAQVLLGCCRAPGPPASPCRQPSPRRRKRLCPAPPLSPPRQQCRRQRPSCSPGRLPRRSQSLQRRRSWQSCPGGRSPRQGKWLRRRRLRRSLHCRRPLPPRCPPSSSPSRHSRHSRPTSSTHSRRCRLGWSNRLQRRSRAAKTRWQRWLATRLRRSRHGRPPPKRRPRLADRRQQQQHQQLPRSHHPPAALSWPMHRQLRLPWPPCRRSPPPALLPRPWHAQHPRHTPRAMLRLRPPQRATLWQPRQRHPTRSAPPPAAAPAGRGNQPRCCRGGSAAPAAAAWARWAGQQQRAGQRVGVQG